MLSKSAAICGIYFILCLTNGSVYVGSSIDCDSRLHRHFRELRLGRHANPIMQRAYMKYGGASFTRGLLELVRDSTELLSREQLWLDSGAATFNIARRAGKPPSSKGRVPSDTTRAKMSASLTGKPKPPRSAAHRAKLSAQGLGRKRLAQHNVNLTAALRGKKRNLTTLNKMSDANSDRHLFEGEMLTLREISERTGIKKATIRNRIRAANPAIAAPVRVAKKYACFGEELTVDEISERTGIASRTLYHRARKGKPLVENLQVSAT